MQKQFKMFTILLLSTHKCSAAGQDDADLMREETPKVTDNTLAQDTIPILIMEPVFCNFLRISEKNYDVIIHFTVRV